MRRCWLFGWLFLAVPVVILAQAQDRSIDRFIDATNAVFTQIVEGMTNILFFSLGGVPLIVLWLSLGAIFFTWRMNFVNLWALKHALFIVLGRYDDPDEAGEVTHFEALSTALSATVGLGNIAGVAIAIQLGGPGAVFWMTVAGLFGMTSKFVECTLAQKYRIVKSDGTVLGGPMYYLWRGLSEMGLHPLGQGLGIFFAFVCLSSALGGGNMFQTHESYIAVSRIFPLQNWLYGFLMASLVGAVILGGIRRIAKVASTLVPLMAAIYTLACLWVLGVHATELGGAIATILREALSPGAAITGGAIGVFVQGIRRAVFSHEAGLGSAAIAHAAARTREPIREGLVGLLEPFIDTVLICNMTALTIVVTGAYQFDYADGLAGVLMTSKAFGTVIPWFPSMLAAATFLFALSTMISWSYYGEQCWIYLVGEKYSLVYRLLFVFCIFLGSVREDLTTIIDFSDMTFFVMAFPNLLGCFLLSGKVAADLDDYMKRLNSGKMEHRG
ncbi:alanine:cation symporter family protein [Oscillatoriales cyanobacterium LEGE 11467]|uniref:Alanine:cation symporter family protein n=1 Tax=Zarconia navalis LEGE 11467 TaxID=1828826 RepID=A0A928Z9Q5_9CYAN|nr:alanine/glycine:cation symporter family protein [Zarconia navalis]MBE9041006.1 alanine:cation symporter family protein [Zarconia navalis LEGE 11467]